MSRTGRASPLPTFTAPPSAPCGRTVRVWVTARATSRASTKSRYAPSGPKRTLRCPAARAARRVAAARPGRVPSPSPAPSGFVRRSAAACTRPARTASSIRAVPASLLAPYGLRGRAGSSSRLACPCGVRPYSAAEDRCTRGSPACAAAPSACATSSTFARVRSGSVPAVRPAAFTMACAPRVRSSQVASGASVSAAPDAARTVQPSARSCAAT